MNCVQQDNEPLSDYIKRFIQVKAQATNVPEAAVIVAAIEGVATGQCASYLACSPPKSVTELFTIMNQYAKSDSDYQRRKATQSLTRQAAKMPRPRQQQPRSEASDLFAPSTIYKMNLSMGVQKHPNKCRVTSRATSITQPAILTTQHMVAKAEEAFAEDEKAGAVAKEARTFRVQGGCRTFYKRLQIFETGKGNEGKRRCIPCR